MHPSFTLQIENECLKGETLLQRVHSHHVSTTTWIKNRDLGNVCEVHSDHTSTITPWIAALFSFLKEWFDESETISVKTSGSTGDPRPILLNKSAMRASANLTCDYFGLRPSDRALLCLSADYIAGKMMLVRAIERGLHLIAVSPQGCPLSSITETVQFAAMVPLQVQRCLDEQCLDRTEQLLIGGAAPSNQLLQSLQNSRTACYISYGMTETMSHVALRRLNGEGASLWYEGLNGIHFSLDRRGCLFIDAAPLGIENIQTNDLCALRDEHHFRWLGRVDFVINSGGIKIIPEQIELLLSSEVPYPFFISSIPHLTLGEQVVLIIESVADETMASMILQKAIEVCPQYQAPKQILFQPHFSYTASGKIDRNQTRKQCGF